MIVSNRDSLCMRVLRTKYKIKHDWLRSDPPRTASPIWRAIERAKSIILKGACYLIGDGSSVDTWRDPWLPWIQDFTPKPRDVNINQPPLKVSRLIDSDLHCWKALLVIQLFDPALAQAILSIPIPLCLTPNKLIWVLDSKGAFTVKSTYQATCHLPVAPPALTPNWKKLWNMKAPKKTKGMFGNCFFPLFSVFKNNFLFLKLKNLFGNSKWTKNKNYFQNSICEGN